MKLKKSLSLTVPSKNSRFYSFQIYSKKNFFQKIIQLFSETGKELVKAISKIRPFESVTLAGRRTIDNIDQESFIFFLSLRTILVIS